MSQFVWNITKKQKEIYNETIDNGRVTKTYVAEILKQAFIQALLSTVAFRQRFSFFTACLVNYLDEVLPWWATKEKFLKFRFHIAGKFISNTPSDCRSIASTPFVYSGSDFFWDLRLPWGVRLSFLTQFKIEFLLPFTGCRKMLEKIPVQILLPWQIHLLKYFY